MISSAASSGGEGVSAANTNRYPPCRSVVDPTTGSKWRLCAAAAVIDTSSEPPRLLIGERLGVPGSWQCPQGGVDDADTESEDEARRTRGETVAEAAARELYEEMGLEAGTHVEIMEDLSGGGGDDTIIGGVAPVRYETTGTGSWLEKAGFTGQELRWAVFRCVSDDVRRDPAATCNLSGLNGERAEFSDVRWEEIDAAVEGIWEKKRGPYEALKEFLQEKGAL